MLVDHNGLRASARPREVARPRRWPTVQRLRGRRRDRRPRYRRDPPHGVRHGRPRVLVPRTRQGLRHQLPAGPDGLALSALNKSSFAAVASWREHAKTVLRFLVAAAADASMVFLTGDLGFMALEPLQRPSGIASSMPALPSRTWSSVAAGLAREGLDRGSTASHLSATPGPSSRSATMSPSSACRCACRQRWRLWLRRDGTDPPRPRGLRRPCSACRASRPSRRPSTTTSTLCGRAARPPTPPTFGWAAANSPRAMSCPRTRPGGDSSQGGGAVVIAVGPLAGGYMEARAAAADRGPPLGGCANCRRTRFRRIPRQIARSRALLVAEEHVAPGRGRRRAGAAPARAGDQGPRFATLGARATSRAVTAPSAFYRRQCGLDPESMLTAVAPSCRAARTSRRASPDPLAPRTDPGPRASGFIGANLLQSVCAVRNDVFGARPAARLAARGPARRPDRRSRPADSPDQEPGQRRRPQTIFDCVAYGAYSFEKDGELIYQTNFQFISTLSSARCGPRRSPPSCMPAARPSTEPMQPARAKTRSSPTAITPCPRSPRPSCATSESCKRLSLRQPAPLRGVRAPRGHLATDPDAAAQRGRRRPPPLVDPRTSRDFIHVDDVVEASFAPPLRWPEPLRRDLQHRHRPEDDHRASSPSMARVFGLDVEPKFEPWKAGLGSRRLVRRSRKAIAPLGWKPRSISTRAAC